MKNIQKIILFLAALLLVSDCATREFRQSSAKDSFISSDPAIQVKLNQVKPLINQGNRDFQAGKYDQAASLGDEANHIYPTAEGYYLIGASHFRLDQYDQAMVSLEDGLKISPDNEQIGLTYAMVLTSRGEEEKALAVYDDLINHYPKEKLYQFKKGVILKSLKKYKDAWTVLKKADEGEPPAFAAQLYMQLGDVALQLKKFDEAEEYFGKAKKTNPELDAAGKSQSETSVAKLLEEGNNAIKEKKYTEAVLFFRKAVESSDSPSSPNVFLGNALLLDGKIIEAENAFRKAIELNPHNAEAYSSLATLYLKNGEYQKAKNLLEEANQLFPKDSALQNKMGLAIKGLGDDKVAVVWFSRAIDYNPNYDEARYNLVYQLIALGRYREARKELAQVKENQAEIAKLIDVKEEIGQGDSDLRVGKIDKAMAHYQKARGINRKEPAVFNAFGRAWFIKKNLKNSEKSYQEALELDKENIPAIQGLIRLYNRFNKTSSEKKYKTILQKIAVHDPLNAILVGREFEDDEKYDKALDEYKRILKQNPDNESAKFRTGIVYYKMALQANSMDQFDKALQLLQEARKYNTDIPEMAVTERNIKDNKKFEKIIPQVRKANNLYDSGKYEQAASLYRNAYEKSNKISLLVKIAESYLSMGEEEKGIRILKNAAAEKDSELDVKEAINSYLLRKGEVKKAEAGFREILEKRPDSYYSNYQLGLIELTKKNYDQAIEYFDKSIIFNSSYIPAIAGRGISYYKRGKKEQALEEFKEAAKKDDTLEVAPFNIGMVFYNDKMFAQARSVFEDVIKKYPDFPDAYYHLAYINFYYGDMKKAEANIKKALGISRKPEFLYAYIKILETLSRKKPDPSYQVTQVNLSRELTERFPSSDYATKAKKKLVSVAPDMVITQPYRLRSSLASNPFVLNGKLLLNYGTSIVLMDKGEKSVTWKTETDKPFKDVAAYSRLYAINGNSVHELDLYDGKIIKSVTLSFEPSRIFAWADTVVVRGKSKKNTALAVFDSSLKLLNEKTYGKNEMVALDESGKIYVLKSGASGLEINIGDSSSKATKRIVVKKETTKANVIARLPESILVKTNGRYYEILAKGDYNQIQMTEKNPKIWTMGTQMFFSSNKGVYALESGNKKPELISDFDFAIPSEDKILMIDRNGQTELKKKSGTSIWKGKLDKYKSIGRQEIYSVIFK